MKKIIHDQITALRKVHEGLTEIVDRKHEVVLAGPLPFEACPRDRISMHGSFDVELHIPDTYPRDLPRTIETSKEISSNYPHVYKDGFLCLETPAGELEQFQRRPVLLGYINLLVIPYLYSYCYWKKFGQYPFGERAHYGEGIVQYYTKKLQLKPLNQEAAVLAIVRYLYERDYNKNDPCPCGSGKAIRNCHKKKLQKLSQLHTQKSLEIELRYLTQVPPR